MIFLIIGLVVGVSFGGATGVRYGKEIAVDQSLKRGFFIAYGKKYKAISHDQA